MNIGVVNDVPMAVEALRRALALEPRFRVVWVARNGAEAVEYCRMQLPDLVLMDLIMPTMDGVEATRQIMTATPCPILVVTVSVGENARRVYEAMGHGALDAVDTPPLGAGDRRASAAPLLAKIALIERQFAARDREPSRTSAQFSVATEPTSAPSSGAASASPPAAPDSRVPLVAIGASAGGPAALQILLAQLPPRLDATIVIIQHVDERFAAGMADWLSLHSPIPVRVAREGDRPVVGTVLLAGSADHLTFKGRDRLGYTPDPVDYPYRPSVDVFFKSACQHATQRVVGVILTGMGRDGAKGLKALRANGHHTISQDQHSSAVYGMPKAAAELDAAVEILPLARIAPAIVHTVQRYHSAVHP